MTIICTLCQDGQTWIGSDTLSSNSNYTFSSVHKWTTRNGRAIGFAGDQRVEELVISARDDLFGTTKTPFEVGKYMRQLCLDDGFEPARDDKGYGFPHFGQCDLYVDTTGIYALDGAFTPAVVNEPFWACGSGADVAFGAFYVLTGKDPQDVMRATILAAMRYDDGCGGDVWIERLI